MDGATITVERDGPVAILTLDRPKRRNALGTEAMRALAAALREADRDPAVGAIVLAGSPPAFCAGSDLKELGGLTVDAMCDHELETAAVARSIGHLSKVVVAAVEGYALGGGFILACSCDVVVTATDARWNLPEVRIGWLPPWGLQALVARVGPVKARLITLGTEPIDGTEALRLGIADLGAEPGGALARARTYAAAVAALPREAVASTKRFYEPLVAAEGERLDAVAARAFASDCEGPVAKATLARFTVPA